MGTADEIEKMQALREKGALTEAEFTQAKAALLDRLAKGGAPSSPGMTDPLRNFYRSTTDKWLGGVCGGLGELTAVPSWFWRLLFCLLFLFGGMGLLVYVLLWVLVPLRPN